MVDDGNGGSVSINFMREIWTSVAITEGPKLHDKCIKKLAISRTFGDVFTSLTDDRWIQSENVGVKKRSPGLYRYAMHECIGTASSSSCVELSAPLTVLELFDAKYIRHMAAKLLLSACPGELNSNRD